MKTIVSTRVKVARKVGKSMEWGEERQTDCSRESVFRGKPTTSSPGRGHTPDPARHTAFDPYAQQEDVITRPPLHASSQHLSLFPG